MAWCLDDDYELWKVWSVTGVIETFEGLGETWLRVYTPFSTAIGYNTLRYQIIRLVLPVLMSSRRMARVDQSDHNHVYCPPLCKNHKVSVYSC